MSMQRIYNYGSSLQAYALRRLIEGVQPAAEVGFIDYEPGTPLISAEAEPSKPQGRIRRILSKLREYGDVDAKLRDKLRFFNHKRTYAVKYFPAIGITADRNRDLGIDLQVIGSDEVFNCVQSNINVGYSRDLFGHNSPAQRVVSYAGSFGNTTLAKIDAAGIREQLADDFSEFAAISVRDRNSAHVVESLTGRAAEIHLDPTLVYDFASDPLIPTARQHPGKYVIVYGYSGRLTADENAAVRRYADSIHARVLAFGGLQSSADEFVDCDPFTLLAYFRDASAVITDTFHGTIFSIINEVPFAAIIRTSSGHGYGNEEKLGFLLDILELGDRALRGDDELAGLLDRPIDYTETRLIREREQVRSIDYLSSVLSRSDVEQSR
ncbi:hypothetical protein ASD65_15645 [Microbacterium sp. Root61]|uniref:polysaccharide pyruvyl transferase family protein n=1 Tax=Microbacterium sp. Root61 TaxID=1736570 RepID=UPI0006FAE572|nr:polysaccharide pyruvyl transferase family protein [Microbacterium sp. Root61]KRA25696.1 hypothetical protein ASD65_15645 [Microbacterium sp. Root61]